MEGAKSVDSSYFPPADFQTVAVKRKDKKIEQTHTHTYTNTIIRHGWITECDYRAQTASLHL